MKSDWPNGLSPEAAVMEGKHREAGGRIQYPHIPVARIFKKYIRAVLLIEMFQGCIKLAGAGVSFSSVLEPEFTRASGQCVCDQCGLSYLDHPEDPLNRPLVILCDKSRVKL